MGLPKGRTNNPKGREVGSKNVRTLEWERIKDTFLSVHTARANRILATMDDDKFMDAYLKLLEYFKPKMSRAEITNSDSTEIKINVEWDADTQFIHTTTKAALKSGESPKGSEEV